MGKIREQKAARELQAKTGDAYTRCLNRVRQWHADGLDVAAELEKVPITSATVTAACGPLPSVATARSAIVLHTHHAGRDPGPITVIQKHRRPA